MPTSSFESKSAPTANTMIVCDYREHALLTHLPTAETQNLDIGDIVIRNEAGKELIIERKTWADLKSSLSDGRYSEQKARLLAYRDEHEHCKIVYLFEGHVPTIADEKQSRAASIKMAVRDGISVIYSGNAKESAKTLEYLQKCLLDGTLEAEHKRATVEASGYAGVVHHSKKRKNAEENMAAIMLCAIPGVSAVKAKAVLDAFPTLAELVDAVRADGSKAIEAIPIGTKRLGPALAKTVCNAFI